MTVAQQTPTHVPPVSPSAHPRNGRWSGFSHLLRARLLELKREPEVIFWVFGFPLLLALGLGIAFRNKPADVTPVAIVAGPGAENAVSLLRQSPRGSPIRVTVLTEAEASLGFRLGKYDLVIAPDGKGGFQYRYDPARPESVLSRSEVDDALQIAAGRLDPLATSAVPARLGLFRSRRVLRWTICLWPTPAFHGTHQTCCHGWLLCGWRAFCCSKSAAWRRGWRRRLPWAHWILSRRTPASSPHLW